MKAILECLWQLMFNKMLLHLLLGQTGYIYTVNQSPKMYSRSSTSYNHKTNKVLLWSPWKRLLHKPTVHEI